MLYLRLALVLALVAGTAYVTHRVELARYDELQLAYDKAKSQAVAEAHALQLQEDAAAEAADLANARAQVTILDQTVTLTRQVNHYVPDHSLPCIPVGFVRLLDAAALGVDPASLPLAAGQSDATCSTVNADDLASSVIGNYGIARSNAERLDALSIEALAVGKLAPKN